MGLSPLLLDTQYRMHPAIAAFPSAAFYGGKLLSAPKPRDRPPPPGFPWPNPKVRTLRHHGGGGPGAAACTYSLEVRAIASPTRTPRRGLDLAPRSLHAKLLRCRIVRGHTHAHAHTHPRISKHGRRPAVPLPPPRSQAPVCFIPVRGRESRTTAATDPALTPTSSSSGSTPGTPGSSSTTGYSYLNEAEAEVVAAVVGALLAPGGGLAGAGDVGVVTPYNGQVQGRRGDRG